MTPMKIKVGLTGSIGSGKTLLAKALKAMGYPVYDSDQRARQMYLRKDVREEVRQKIGKQVFNESGMIDLKILARVIFQDSAKLQSINKIIHPRVLEDFTQWADRQKSRIVFQESALLFESGFSSYFHYTIMVSAPGEIRIERIMNRDGISRDDVLERMQHQMSDDEKSQKTDFVIVNDGKYLIMPRLNFVLEQIDKKTG